MVVSFKDWMSINRCGLLCSHLFLIPSERLSVKHVMRRNVSQRKADGIANFSFTVFTQWWFFFKISQQKNKNTPLTYSSIHQQALGRKMLSSDLVLSLGSLTIECTSKGMNLQSVPVVPNLQVLLSYPGWTHLSVFIRSLLLPQCMCELDTEQKVHFIT